MIKSTLGLEQTRIVAVTASVTAGDRERIAASGFDGCISKPIDPETFIANLDRFLPTRATVDIAADAQ